MLIIEAPNTFLMPASLVRYTAMNETKPYKPGHEINMAAPANILYNCESWFLLLVKAGNLIIGKLYSYFTMGQIVQSHLHAGK